MRPCVRVFVRVSASSSARLRFRPCVCIFVAFARTFYVVHAPVVAFVYSKSLEVSSLILQKTLTYILRVHVVVYIIVAANY